MFVITACENFTDVVYFTGVIKHALKQHVGSLLRETLSIGRILKKERWDLP